MRVEPSADPVGGLRGPCPASASPRKRSQVEVAELAQEQAGGLAHPAGAGDDDLVVFGHGSTRPGDSRPVRFFVGVEMRRCVPRSRGILAPASRGVNAWGRVGAAADRLAGDGGAVAAGLLGHVHGRVGQAQQGALHLFQGEVVGQVALQGGHADRAGQALQVERARAGSRPAARRRCC